MLLGRFSGVSSDVTTSFHTGLLVLSHSPEMKSVSRLRELRMEPPRESCNVLSWGVERPSADRHSLNDRRSHIC